MAKTDYQSIDEYIATLPESSQKILQQIRAVVHEAVPEAEEVISYQIPAFKYHGFVLYMSAYASHYSLSFPPPFTVFEVFKKELAGYKQSKSTVQFPLDQPVPVQLIRDVAAYRAKENLDRSR